MHNKSLILSYEQQRVLDAMFEGRNIALFGDAGTGKSVIVRQFLKEAAHNGTIVCLAPTGLAARNIGKAQTVHSFFKIDPGCVGVKNYQLDSKLFEHIAYVQTLIIDEISMLRSDIFDIIEFCLSSVPLQHGQGELFGGRQIIVVGDFKQLPPVVSDENIKQFLDENYRGEYAFMSRSWKLAAFKNFYLYESFRQDCEKYFDILRYIRNDKNLDEALELCNKRVITSNSKVLKKDFYNDGTVALCCRRDEAAKVNSQQMALLPGPEYCFNASIEGKFPKNDLPTERCLKLKKGARVMILINKREHVMTADSAEQDFEYVNGDIGQIVEIYDNGVSVQLSNGRTVRIQKMRWFSYEYDLIEEHGRKKIVAQKSGSFEQLPLAVAYATTIHKAQGQTLDKIYLKLGEGCFAYGQLYTALSRIRKLDCLYLEEKINIPDVIQNPKVDDFYNTRIWER